MIQAKDAIAADLAALTPARVRAASIDELRAIAANIRQFLIDSTAATGGHIGANLGTIELSLAIHHVFDSPADRIIWDTGHQGYTHKIITGRAGRFPTLNTFGGMSRFVTKTESEHDTIEASHGGTAISIGLGIALAKALKGDERRVVSVIGDGSLAEGLAFEGLNHAAVATHTKLMIVLNDNGYAISPGFGALHDYLQSLQPGQREPERLFTALGFDYVGPVDGHDVDATVRALERAKDSKRVPVVHAKTEKGHGWKPADSHPFRMHFSFPFDPDTGKGREGFAYVGYPDVAAAVIGEEMARNERIVAITPSTLYASGLASVFRKFPDRTFDPGMEEQHAMTMTVGFALEGYTPVIVFQSTFMQRAFDQLVHDVCFGNLPTLILAVRSGFAGYDNPTHHGIYDFAYWRGLPNLRVMYPKDRYETERMVRDALRALSGPTIIATPYGPVDELDSAVLEEPAAEFGQPQTVLEGRGMTILAVGHKFKVARDAADRLRRAGIECGLVNLRYLKPLPEQALAGILARAPRVVTIEEAVIDGGIGSAVAAFAADRRIRCEVLRIAAPTAFLPAGSQDELCRLTGLDVDGVLKTIRGFWALDV